MSGHQGGRKPINAKCETAKTLPRVAPLLRALAIEEKALGPDPPCSPPTNSADAANATPN